MITKRPALLLLLPLLLTACSDDTTEPGSDSLAEGDIVTLELTASVAIEDVVKSALDITLTPMQVTIEARVIEVHRDFLDLRIQPKILTELIIGSASGTIKISDDSLYPSWCCLSRLDDQGNPIGTTSGAIALTIQLADSPTVMIGDVIALTDDPLHRERLVPLLGDIPMMNVLFNSVNHEVRTSELVILMSPRIIESR